MQIMMPISAKSERHKNGGEGEANFLVASNQTAAAAPKKAKNNYNVPLFYLLLLFAPGCRGERERGKGEPGVLSLAVFLLISALSQLARAGCKTNKRFDLAAESRAAGNKFDGFFFALRGGAPG